MKRHVILSLAVVLMLFLDALPTNAANFYVRVDYYSLSPDPVRIKMGDVVYWIDNDPILGPYLITGGWGTVMTPYGIQFNVPPGNYDYSAESAWGGGSWQGTVVVEAELPPSVSISSPTNGAVFTAPASFSFTADATDPNVNDLWDVEFWVDGSMVDDVYTPPYETTVTNLGPGTYTLKAVAWDHSGATATNSVTIQVLNPAPITLGNCCVSGGQIVFSMNGLSVGTTNVLECSSNLVNWYPVLTNVSDSTSLNVTNSAVAASQFFRVMQVR